MKSIRGGSPPSWRSLAATCPRWCAVCDVTWNIDSPKPTVLGAHELLEGKSYYILPTTTYLQIKITTAIAGRMRRDGLVP